MVAPVRSSALVTASKAYWPVNPATTANMLMPTKASSRRPRSPIDLLDCRMAPSGVSLVKGRFPSHRHCTGPRFRAGASLENPDLAIVTLGSGVQRQRHSSCGLAHRDAARGRVRLHELIEVGEDGLGHRIDRVGADVLSRHEEIEDRSGFDVLGWSFVCARGNDRWQIGRVADLIHNVLWDGQDPDRHLRRQMTDRVYA